MLKPTLVAQLRRRSSAESTAEEAPQTPGPSPSPLPLKAGKAAWSSIESVENGANLRVWLRISLVILVCLALPVVVLLTSPGTDIKESVEDWRPTAPTTASNHGASNHVNHATPILPPQSWSRVADKAPPHPQSSDGAFCLSEPLSAHLDPCEHTRGVVVIPAVLKGVSNQRLRIIQDTVAAKIVGAAVVLPRYVVSRRNCHYRVDCFQDYIASLPFWEVIDRNATISGLRAAGICVLDDSQIAGLRRDDMEMEKWFGRLDADVQCKLQGGWCYDRPWKRAAEQRPEQLLSSKTGLIAASQLEAKSAQMRRSPAWGPRRAKPSGPLWAWGDEADCCTLLIADTAAAADDFAAVSRALVTAPTIRALAQTALSEFNTGLEPVGTPPVSLALHWRSDPEFAKHPVHKLDLGKYTLETARVLRNLAGGARLLRIIVLGDLDAGQLKALSAHLSAAMAILRDRERELHPRVAPQTSPTLELHSKEALLSAAKITDWRAFFRNFDDLFGLLDMEIGATAPGFVGAPFSSFSAVISQLRAGQPHLLTARVPVDVADRLATIFDLQLGVQPSADRCAALKEVATGRTSKKWSSFDNCPRGTVAREWAHTFSLAPPRERARVRPATCDKLAPGFTFDPPLDSVERLGYECHLAIVTSTFGGYDKLKAYSERFQAKLLRLELTKVGLRSCWFAFADAVSVRKLKGGQHAAGCHTLAYGQWTVVNLPDTALPHPRSDPHAATLNSRVPKMLSHCVLTRARYVLYLDAKAKFTKPSIPWQLLYAASQPLEGNNKVRTAPAWVAPHHPSRSSIYEEALCTYVVGLATVETFRQLKQYAEEGYPRKPYVEGGPGLVEGEWHLRDLEAPEGEALGTGWYEEFLKWRHIHRRDQLSFNYVAWKLGTSALRGFKYVSTKLAGAVPFDASHMLKRADHLRRHVANESALQKATRPSSRICPNAIFAPGNHREMDRLIDGVRRLAVNQAMAQTVHAAISAVQDHKRMNVLVERMNR